MKRAIWLMGVLMAATVLWAASASAALSNADACEVAKLKAAGDYVSCRMDEEAKAITLNVPPGFTLCDAKIAVAFAKAESTYGGACPTIGDLEAVMERSIGDTGLLTTALSGTAPTILRRMPASGEMTCYDGMTYEPTECAGTGQDAEFMAGVARMDEFKDNGDGTISDVVTGLMWEKKMTLDGMPSPAELHDADNLYALAGTCTDSPTSFCLTDGDCPAGLACEVADGGAGAMTAVAWVAKLNEGAGFAGYTDWRLPNIRELGTIVCYGTCMPASPIFFHEANCATCADITDPACSCTAYYAHWSSTTCNQFKPSVWWVDFVDGRMDHNNPNYPLAVRAVRGGL